MATFVTVIHIITCALIVLVVLMQSGKGAEISASLGGSSNTVFGSSGGANFFTKTTFVLAAIFMTTSLGLTVLGGRERRSVFEGGSIPATTNVPAAPDAQAVPPPAGAANTTSAPAQAPAAPADSAKK
jgi:preprotein translocase subunit SecG